jgi:hypothetical protein
MALIAGQLPAQAAELIAPSQDAAQAPAAPAAPADTSPDALDHLLAPVALYPDALLMQVLAASVDSQEVLDAGNWLLENKSLEGSKLDEAAKKVGFGAAMTALLHFPDVVDMMCTQLDWTKQLGAAFQADQAAVLASVQRLRAQAVQYGSLKTTPQQQVVTQTDNGKQVIVIQPANPQVVYVPQYDPQTVYVAPPPGPSTGDIVAASVISFGVGMAIGSLFSSNNYYYPRWGYGGVYYGGRPWVPAHYAYRPIYGPHYRPAYGYRPPANYPYHRPNYNNNYYNRYHGGNNTININNNNRPGNGYNGNNNRPGNGNNNRPGSGNGYNGNNNNRPGNGNNTRPVSGNNGSNNRPGNGNGYNGNNNNRPVNGNNNRPGNGGYNKPGNNGGATTRPVSGGNNISRPAPDRGYAKPATQPARPTSGAGASRPPSQQTRPATGGASRPPSQQARPAPSNNRQASAFSSGGGSGRSVNAASQRGAASAGGRKR